MLPQIQVTEGGLTHPRGEGQGETCPQWRHQLTGQQLVRVTVPGRQRRVGVVAGLVIVVLDIEASHFRVVDAESAAAVVDVLAVKCL